jgi:ribose 5-phosphate isomerase B
MKVILGSDHRGLELKESAKQLLKELNIPYEDMGANVEEQSDDYPDYAAKVALAVAEKPSNRGLLFCGSGIGMSIAANKVSGIRAAAPWDMESAVLSRRHNDANVLALGALVFTPKQSNDILRAWLETEFEGGRHQRRVDKISRLERDQIANA